MYKNPRTSELELTFLGYHKMMTLFPLTSLTRVGHFTPLPSPPLPSPRPFPEENRENLNAHSLVNISLDTAAMVLIYYSLS